MHANVTREHKLALIVGFSLVLVVGVLISDHFSKARSQQLATEMSPGTAERFGADTRGLRVIPESSQGPAIASGPQSFSNMPPSELPSSAEPSPLSTPMSTEIVMGRSPEEAVHGNGLLQRAIELGNGTGPLAGAIRTPLDSGEHPSGVRTIDPQTGQRQPGTMDPTLPRDPLVGQVTPPSTPEPARETLVNGVPRDLMKRHDVREGESIYRIAQETYGDGKLWPKLVEYNKGKMSANGSVREGVTLLLPPKEALLGKPLPSAPSDSEVAPRARTTPESRLESKPAVKPESKPDKTGRTYVVQKGDSLSEIAQRQLGSSRRWLELVELNKSTLPDADSLVVGMTLKLPAK